MSSRNDKRKELFGTLPIEDQNYIAKFGWEMWKKKEKIRLETEIEEEEQTEIQETTKKIPDITKMGSWSEILKSRDAKAYLKLFVKIVEMMNEVRVMENWHGYTYILIKTPNGTVFIKQQEIAVNPESEDEVLKGIDEMPEDRVIMEDTEEDEE